MVMVRIKDYGDNEIIINLDSIAYIKTVGEDYDMSYILNFINGGKVGLEQEGYNYILKAVGFREEDVCQ